MPNWLYACVLLLCSGWLLTECVDGRPASRLAGLQCVSGVVILVLICVGQGLVRCRHCIRHITLHSTVVP